MAQQIPNEFKDKSREELYMDIIMLSNYVNKLKNEIEDVKAKLSLKKGEMINKRSENFKLKEKRAMNILKVIFAFIMLFGLFLSIPHTNSFCSTGELYVGTAKLDITPPVGIRMSGYSSRKDPSEGIHDPLYARFLVMDVDGYRVGIITCDLIGYMNKNILDIAREQLNIPHLLICSSHTHSGPNISDSESYSNRLEKIMIDGLNEATKNMFPARISAGSSTFPQLGYNRLTMREDGHRRALWETWDRIPYGPVDPEVGMIKIEDKNGNPRVILMMYACHSVVNTINYDISADYPGAATRIVEETFGNNTMCMFVQGGAGDINPLFRSPYRGPDGDPPTDYTQKEKMGAILANEVIKVVKSIPTQINEKTSLEALCDSLKFTGRFDKSLTYNMHFTTVLINDDIAIATMLAEPFVEFQLFWKERAEVPHPFFFGYTFSSGGKSPGYVADIRSAAYGGYGADSSERAAQFGAGETIMNKHLENLYRLRGIVRYEPGPR